MCQEIRFARPVPTSSATMPTAWVTTIVQSETPASELVFATTSLPTLSPNAAMKPSTKAPPKSPNTAYAIS